jgi:hypothetical protein
MLSATELNNKMFLLIQISSQESMLLKSIEKFYSTLKYVNDFISIINSNSKISIRLIDYFVTKYSKKNKINCKISEDNVINIYQSYKQQLKAFQKKNFDPFARGLRIPYYIKDIWIITTIGQLNFFKWFISKNIFDYVNKNKDRSGSPLNRKKINLNENKNDSFRIQNDYQPNQQSGANQQLKDLK